MNLYASYVAPRKNNTQELRTIISVLIVVIVVILIVVPVVVLVIPIGIFVKGLELVLWLSFGLELGSLLLCERYTLGQHFLRKGFRFSHFCQKQRFKASI